MLIARVSQDSNSGLTSYTPSTTATSTPRGTGLTLVKETPWPCGIWATWPSQWQIRHHISELTGLYLTCHKRSVYQYCQTYTHRHKYCLLSTELLDSHGGMDGTTQKISGKQRWLSLQRGDRRGVRWDWKNKGGKRENKRERIRAAAVTKQRRFQLL